MKRLFVVCGSEYAEEAKACVPAETDAEIIFSEMYSELMDFLKTPDQVLVLNRSAIPMVEAGPGFAYTAAGYELQDAWKEKLTNNVQGATLVGGWVPVYYRSVIDELEPILRQRSQNGN